jgi:glycerol-3-phosphate dehydrogenase (NAD(P)+)
MLMDGQNGERLSGCAFPAGLTPTASLPEAVARADVVLLAAPSKATVAVAEAAAAHARKGAPVLICAKGLGERGALLSDCVQRVWRGPVLVLSGPSFADEVAQNLPTIVTLAGPMPLAARLADQLSADRFVLCPSDDVTGVQIAAVFKNVAATLCGVSDGVEFGVNARAALMSEAMREAACVIRALGGSVETLLGPAGFGDFALTCTDAKSRNYSFGRQLGQGGAASGSMATREGAANVEALLRLARRIGVDAPLAAAVSDLLAGRLSAREAVEAAFAWRREQALEAVRAA